MCKLQKLKSEMKDIKVWRNVKFQCLWKNSKKYFLTMIVSPNDETSSSKAANENDPSSTLLKKANILSKSSPRRSFRTKWRAKSGHTPTMISDNSSSGTLFKGDMVFHRDVTESIVQLVVSENFCLVDKSIPLLAHTVGENNVSVEKLILDGQ